MPITKPIHKVIALVSPGLLIRDGITAHSINLVRGWLETGHQVVVWNPGRFRLEQEAFFDSLSVFDRYLSQGHLAVRGIRQTVPDFDVLVIQYAISTYWLRTFWVHMWLRNVTKSKVVICLHEPAREINLLGKIGKAIYRDISRLGQELVVFSKAAETVMAAITRTPVTVAPLAVPSKKPSSGSQLTAPSFLMLGYYLKDKGFELGLKSFIDTLVKTSVPINLSVIVSPRQRLGSSRIFSKRDQKQFEEFEAQIKDAQRSHPGLIKVFGFLSDSEMENLISSSDYLVMPYLDITNSGVAVTAKAHGIPVIASDLPPLIEAFGNTGIYFKAGDSRALSEALEAVVRAPNWQLEREQRAKEMLAMGRSQPGSKNALLIIDAE
jgi:glycosyltransferase involved in cell wall biosynthesis